MSGIDRHSVVNRPLALILVLVLLGACVSGTGSIERPPGDSDLLRTNRGSGGGGMSAIVEGTVEIDLQLGCVWLSTADGSRHPLVWPAGTISETDPFVILLRDGQTVSDGDHVSGGGGYVDAVAATSGTRPFPAGCVQDGQAAVFNADSRLVVTAGTGLDVAETLVGRFPVPESIGLELIAVNPNRRSMAIADLVTGTVHLYESGDYAGPDDAIDGASGGGGFIHIWADGTVYSYPGRLVDQPLVYRPEPSLEIEGIASTLEVLPAPDDEHIWLVQDGIGFSPTLVELVNLVEVEVTRMGSIEVPGSWQPVGTTNAGLILIANEGAPRTLLIDVDGVVATEVSGEAISVGWSGTAIVEDGELRLLGPDLGGSLAVERPSPGTWVSLGGPPIPSTSPPLRTGGAAHLVGLAVGDGPDRVTELIVVSQDGSTRTLGEVVVGAVATFSRAEDWVVVVDQAALVLYPSRGDAIRVDDIFPTEHWVLSAG